MAHLLDDDTGDLIKNLWPKELGRIATDPVDIADCAFWEAVPSNDVDLSEWMQIVPNPCTGDKSRPFTVTHVPDAEDGNEDGAELYELAVRFNGFIERANLGSLGNWDGTERGAVKAVQTLVLSGGGYTEPWLATIRALDRLLHVAVKMAKPEQDDADPPEAEVKTQVFMQRRVFVKASTASAFNVPSDAAHRGPGLHAVSNTWHLGDRMEFARTGHDGNIKHATSVVFRPGHFVEVTAYIELIAGRDGRMQARLRPGKVVLVSTQGQGKGRPTPAKVVKILKSRIAVQRPSGTPSTSRVGEPEESSSEQNTALEGFEDLHVSDDYAMAE